MITLTQLIFIIVCGIIAIIYVLFFYHPEENSHVEIEEECLEQETVPELREQRIDMSCEELNTLIYIKQIYLASILKKK